MAAPVHQDKESGSEFVKLTDIIDWPFNPRKTFDDEKLNELADAIRLCPAGLLNPIIVRPHPNVKGKFQGVRGQRRWLAHQRLGLKEIRASIRDLNDDECWVVAIQDNLKPKAGEVSSAWSGEPVTPMELACAIKAWQT
ncbi:ParB/RepB/Spo0J family partition protein [Candidatus Bathyarchaeota archaeon]|nr:ParB/RepB/Spo0J family partition protein [Candidatus Bathyarchaeota archaeon]